MTVKGLFWRQTNQNLNPNCFLCVTPEILVNLTQLYLPMYKLKARIMYMLQDCGDKIHIPSAPNLAQRECSTNKN